VELAWKSDQHRFWSPKNTRLFVEYEMMFGEVDETCASIESGPVNSTGAPPSRSLRMTSMPNSTLFDSQVRYVCNNTVVEQSNYYSDLCQAQLLTTSNIEGTNTSASGMLTSLRKDAGIPTGIMRGQQSKSTMGDGYELCPVVPAPYVTDDDGSNGCTELTSDDTLGRALAAITKTDFVANGLIAGAFTKDETNANPKIELTLSSTEATAKLQAATILRCVNSNLNAGTMLHLWSNTIGPLFKSPWLRRSDKPSIPTGQPTDLVGFFCSSSKRVWGRGPKLGQTARLGEREGVSKFWGLNRLT
jgi:hypothetical protein